MSKDRTALDRAMPELLERLGRRLPPVLVQHCEQWKAGRFDEQ